MAMPTFQGWSSKTQNTLHGGNMPGLANHRFQTLALSGGGYRDLFTAKFIASCEKEFQTKCSDRFDLIAGTSTGVLLAAGLADVNPSTSM